MFEEFKYIPAFKSIEANVEFIGPLGEELTIYSNEGKTFTWQFAKYPDGAGGEFGATMQAYVGGEVSKEETLKSLDSSWAKFRK